MYNNIYNYFIVLVLFLVIDIPVIMKLNYNMYNKLFIRINNAEMNPDYLGAIMAYVLLALGLYLFVIKPHLDNENENKNNIFIMGCIFGLVIYGIYNGTNLATINNYGRYEAMIDTTWGTILCGIISTLFIYLKKYI